jgi:hypothetical protein
MCFLSEGVLSLDRTLISDLLHLGKRTDAQTYFNYSFPLAVLDQAQSLAIFLTIIKPDTIEVDTLMTVAYINGIIILCHNTLLHI